MANAQRLPPRALSVIRINRSLWLLVTVICLAAGVAAIWASQPVYGAVVIALGVAFAGLWWWWTGALYRSVEWIVDSEVVQKRSGVIVQSTSVLPRARVQNVTRTTGPVQRWKKVATLTVHSAGAHTPDIVIAHLDEHEADAIRTALLPSETS